MQNHLPVALTEYIDDVGGTPTPSIDLLAILAAVLRRWKLITAMTLFALSATCGVLKFVPSLYRSTVEILAYDPQQQIDAAVQKPISPFVDAVSYDAMNTEMDVIKSKSVALRVASELGLDRNGVPSPQPTCGIGGTVWFSRPGPIRDGNMVHGRREGRKAGPGG